MNKRIYKIALLLFAVVGYTACSSDFLEHEPIGKLASENYLQTESEAQAALYGLYDRMQVNNNNTGEWCSAFLVRVLLSDDSNAGGGGTTDQQKHQEIDDYAHGSDNAAVKVLFESYYKTINMANIIINRVPTTLTTAAAVAAEAKFVRAYNYFQLVTLYGSVPLFTENAASEADYNKPKSSVADIYTQIESDLVDAIAGLPNKSELSAAMKFRASKGAAQSLLGKVQLFQEKYSAAASNFSAVISSGQYDLEPNYGEIWDGSKRCGVESIFEILYSNQKSNDWGGPWDGTAEANLLTVLMGLRGDNSFNNVDVIPGGYLNGWGFNVPTSELGLLFAASVGDLRASSSIMSETDFTTLGGEANRSGTFNWDDYEGYLRLKYSCKASETSPDGVREMNYQTPVIAMRFADVLLMAAEAYHKASDKTDADALVELNKVRLRAGLTAETATGAALMTAIQHERRLELAFEGHRFFDCVRWGIASELGSKFTAGKNELLPIPSSEISSNTSLTVADQNPGY